MMDHESGPVTIPRFVLRPTDTGIRGDNDNDLQSNGIFWLSWHLYTPVISRIRDLTGSFTEGRTP
jgi:hypothetical protein